MTAHEHSESHPAPHAGGHAVHRNYIAIWGILMVLLVISVAGPFAHIRVITLITAFGVALVKAYMVAKNFMHLDIEKPIVGWLLAVILTLMVLLFAGVSPDVMKDDGRNWKKGPGFHTLPPEKAVESGGAHGGHGAESH
jgi:caa(3)-type oxidase subunit IV